MQVGCTRQVLGAGALGWPRGMGWGSWWEGGSVWGTHVSPWLIHVNVWQKPLQCSNQPPANKNNWKIKKKDCDYDLSLFTRCQILFLVKYSWFWWAAAPRVAKSQTQLSDWSHTHTHSWFTMLLSFRFFSRLLRDIEFSSLWYTVGSCLFYV